MAKKNEQAEAAVEDVEEVPGPTALCALSAYRSTAGNVEFGLLDFDDPDFALEVAGKLATAAHEGIRARAEAVANEAAAEVRGVAAGAA
jgi:uncharacterized protein (UPF0264 family)